jgi:hypothetical protein
MIPLWQVGEDVESCYNQVFFFFDRMYVYNLLNLSIIDRICRRPTAENYTGERISDQP